MLFARLPPNDSAAEAFGKAKPQARSPQAGAAPAPAQAPQSAPGAPVDPAQFLQLFGGLLPDGLIAPPPAPAQAPTVTPEEKAEQDKKIRESMNDVQSIVVASQLAMLSRGMNDASSRTFINTLDKIDDPDLRHKVMAQFETQTGQSLHDFIDNCKDWGNNGDNRDKSAALQLIDEKRDKAEDAIAKMSPEEKARKVTEAEAAAQQILSATTGHDHSDENMQKIFRAMEGRSPAEIELLRAAIQRRTHGESNLYQALDDGTHKGDEDEAIAMLAGDRVASARAALSNEDDPARLREVVGGLKPAELEKLKDDPFVSVMLARIKNPSDRAEIGALIAGNKAEANAEHLGNLLKPKDEGFVDPTDKIGQENHDRRKPANVLKEFEAMSGEDVKAAAEAWNKEHPERTFEQMLQDRWGKDDDQTEYKRLLAMMHGEKGLDRSLRLQEGIREEDQDEIEGSLAHEKTDDKALQSEDPEVRKKAEAVRDENQSFEKNNVEADRRERQFVQDWTGGDEDSAPPAVGRSTEDQLTSYYAAEKRKDIGGSANETLLGGQAADVIHADRQRKHNAQVRDDSVGAMELLADGKLSAETEVHRGKGDKEKAEALENIHSNKDLETAKKQYLAKYGTEMVPYSGKDRSDMNANELMMDNVRLYGVKAERPAKVEYLLQMQQYELQYSGALERSEAGEAGGGTQRWQRQELAAERDMLKDPQLAVGDHKVVDVSGIPIVTNDPNEPTFDRIDKLLPIQGEKVDDGLKDGVTKQEFTRQDEGLTAANKAEEGAKKRLAERIVKIFATIAKIAAALIAQPELIALIDVGEGLLEMGIKHEIMGEAYDPSEDAKMLAFTAVADVAMMGLSKVGKLKGAASLAEQKALGAGEKTAMEMEQAASGEAKAVALKEGAHVASGESEAMKGAIEEGTSAEKALSSEAAGQVGQRVEAKAAGVAEGKALQEGETAAAKTVATDVEKGTLTEAEGAAKEVASPEELAKQIEARWSTYGGAAKMAIQTIGGGLVQGKSPSEILKGLVTGSLGLVLPGHLAEKVQAAIGNDSAALKILGEIASFGTEVATNATISVAGGAEGGDAMIDSLIGAGGGRAQRAFGGGHGGASKEEHGPEGREGSIAPAAPGHDDRNFVADDVVDPLPQSAKLGDEPFQATPVRKTEERTPLQERVEKATSGGESHEVEMAKLREFYAQQEVEAANVSTVSYTDVDQFRDVPGAIPGKTKGFDGKPVFHADGSPMGYKGYTNYDVREFSHGVTAIEVRVHLAGAATPEEMARVRAETIANVDGIVNKPENMLTNGAGDESRLHVEVVFVDDPAEAHATVNVESGEGRSDQLNWYAGEPGVQYAHEMMHHLGLGDEYVDPRTVGRKDELAPDVHLDEDSPSLMGGDYLMHDLDNPGRAMANPDTELKQRHMDTLSGKINEQRAADAEPGAAPGAKKPSAPTIPEDSAPRKPSAPDDPQAELDSATDAEVRKADAQSGAEVRRALDAENAAQRNQIDEDQVQIARLQHDLEETSGDKGAIEHQISKLKERVTENEAAVQARAEAASRRYEDEKKSLAARQKQSAEKAGAVKERGETEANAERTAEETARADAVRAEMADKEAREQEKTSKLEQDRLDAMTPGERLVHDGLEEAKKVEAELAKKFEGLGDGEREDTSNPVVADLLAAQDRVRGLENPGERVDARGDFEASQAAEMQRRQAERDQQASESKAVPDAEERQSEAAKREQAQRDEAARNAAQRDQIANDEKELVTLGNERQDAEGDDIAKVDEKIREIEGRVADNEAAVAARAEETSRAYQAQAEAKRAREAASQQAMREAMEKRDAHEREGRAQEEAASSERMKNEVATNDAKAAETARKHDEDVWNAMSPGEQAVVRNLQAAKERLAALDRELDALPEDQKASWPKMAERNDILGQVHGLENPGAPRLDVQATFEADVAENTRKTEIEERARRESEVRVDPEAGARNARAEEQNAAESASARDAAVRRDAITADENRLGAIKDEELEVGLKLEAADKDEDSFAAEDHQAKLDQLRADRQEAEARIAERKADEQARTDEEVLRQNQERAEEQARTAAQKEKLSAQAAEVEARRQAQAIEDKTVADAEAKSRYEEQEKANKVAEEKKAAELRASIDPDLLPLYDALGEHEKELAALGSKVGGGATSADPRVERMNQLAEDIKSLEDTVFPNGRPR